MVGLLEDDRDRPNERIGPPLAKARWEPTWEFAESGYALGATVDDNCLVFLAEDMDGDWVPLTHLPASAIRFGMNLLAKTNMT